MKTYCPKVYHEIGFCQLFPAREAAKTGPAINLMDCTHLKFKVGETSNTAGDGVHLVVGGNFFGDDNKFADHAVDLFFGCFAVTSDGDFYLKRSVFVDRKSGSRGFIDNNSARLRYPHGGFLVGGKKKRFNRQGLRLEFFYNFAEAVSQKGETLRKR